MIRKLALAVVSFCLPMAGMAQSVEHLAVASQFNNWNAYGSVNLVAGANTNVSISPCLVQGDPQHGIPAVAASTPVFIHNTGSPQTDEIVTPTSVVNGSTCTATFTTTNAHPTPWYITSGSGGLQEAINASAQSSLLNVVELDSVWHAAGFGYGTIYAAAGNANLGLVDVTLAPSASFRWNGTHYASSYTVNSGTPALAAGAAAGTSPTVANTTGSTANLMTANVTTGTATTTGTLFTETNTAFASAMNCSVQSVGVNNPPAFTYSATSTVLTVSVTVAPAVSKPYVFNVSCN